MKDVAGCIYQSRQRDRGQFTCSLGWYGGKPWLGNCHDCIKNKRNNAEAKAEFEAREKSKLSIKIGCCGEAYPRLGQMASTVAKAIVDETKSIVSGDDPTDQDTINKRIEMCNSCEFFVKKDERCVKCGCFVHIKASMRSQKCPIGKW